MVGVGEGTEDKECISLLRYLEIGSQAELLKFECASRPLGELFKMQIPRLTSKVLIQITGWA